jgi:hypothetical protein
MNETLSDSKILPKGKLPKGNILFLSEQQQEGCPTMARLLHIIAITL